MLINHLLCRPEVGATVICDWLMLVLGLEMLGVGCTADQGLLPLTLGPSVVTMMRSTATCARFAAT